MDYPVAEARAKIAAVTTYTSEVVREASDRFRKSPSATNWNLLTEAMQAHQHVSLNLRNEEVEAVANRMQTLPAIYAEVVRLAAP